MNKIPEDKPLLEYRTEKIEGAIIKHDQGEEGRITLTELPKVLFLNNKDPKQVPFLSLSLSLLYLFAIISSSSAWRIQIVGG